MSTHSLNLPEQISPLVIHLFKGVIYGNQTPQLWDDLITFQASTRDYCRVIGLDLYIDEVEKYAFLRQSVEEEKKSDTPSLPKVIQRRPLSYSLSLLCVLLRRKLIEADVEGGSTRMVISRDQIVDMINVFLPENGNEAKTVEQVDRDINKVVEYGFLRKMKDQEGHYEVRRIIKALIDANWLNNMEQKLQEYKNYANTTA